MPVEGRARAKHLRTVDRDARYQAGEVRYLRVARDPRWLFSYWDFDWSRYSSSGMRYGYAQFFLKISRPLSANSSARDSEGKLASSGMRMETPRVGM